MRTVKVIDNKIVVEVDGAKISHSLETIQRVISQLSEDLEMWLEYERLLTMPAPDAMDSGENN